ncbi:MAG: flagellar basal body P-ring protein FlgI [Betaproteobacteria bacterium]|nr:flagellar basal body P-ring protein FlgI [Betaproteobacteria bacterium]
MMHSHPITALSLILSILSLLMGAPASANQARGNTDPRTSDDSAPVRLKDLVEFRGVRSNPLVGLGLVVGLSGTGDSKQSLATNKAASNLLTRLGAQVNPAQVVTRNIAAVIVTAELPAFARIGDKLDIRVATVGDSASLEGGTLLMTTLSAADGQVYAVAQGPLSLGTAMTGAEGGGGGNNRSSAPKTIAISQNASVEREFQSSFIHNGNIELSIKNADFTTAHRIAHAINKKFNEFIASPMNSGLIRVRVPEQALDSPSFTPVDFMAVLEQIKVEPDSRAIVVINERTGTIISGSNVTIMPVAISHGNLEIIVQDETRYVSKVPKSTTVGDLVRALNELGAGPKDLVSILQALDAAQALKAQLKLM